jgi:hypothetical protein
VSNVGSVTTAKERRRGNRTLLELVAVALLGIGTVATAWCGFQASRWNGEEAHESRDAVIAQTSASEKYTFGAQVFAYDANMVAQYAQAVASENVKLQQFIRENLVRPAFLPVLDEWVAQITAGQQVTSMFDDQEYLDSLFGESEKARDASAAALERSREAGENGDEYLLTTLITATALFFAGVTTSFTSRPARLLLLTVSAVAIVVTAARLADLPIV